MNRRFCMFLAALMASIGLPGSVVAAPPSFTLQGQKVVGTLDPDGFKAFRGIKFALPPTGERRWAPPEPNRAWAQKGAFTKFEATCATGESLGVFGKTSNEEDCLYLNVYVPAKLKAGQVAPVLAWIPGGGLGTGSGNDYNPAYWTSRGAIVVTLNYRVGIFGFFSDPAIDSANEKAGQSAVNYGLMDQQMALKWIRDNIAAFGGDPNNVTLYGESAGGYSVLSHMVAPGSAGLFQKAIASSGSYAFGTMTSAQLRNLHSQPMVAKTKCHDLEGQNRVSCLRGLSTQEAIAASPSYLAIARFALDPRTYPISVFSGFLTGQINKVPLINGANHDEGTFFTWLTAGMPRTRTMSREAFQGALVAFLGENNMKKVMAKTPQKPGGNYFDNAVRSLGDARFVCRAPLLSRLVSEHTDTYSYMFSPDNPPMYFDAGFGLQTTHTSDLAFVFKNFSGAQGVPVKLRPQDIALSNFMMDSFVSFMKSGNPGPGWRKTGKDESYMYLGNDTQQMRTEFSKAKNCYAEDIDYILDSPLY